MVGTFLPGLEWNQRLGPKGEAKGGGGSSELSLQDWRTTTASGRGGGAAEHLILFNTGKI